MEQLTEILNLIPLMYEEIQKLKAKSSIESKWLSPDEAVVYLSHQYTKETLLKKLDVTFFEGTHYYRQGRKTIFFDRTALDMWIMQKDAINEAIDSTVASLLKDI